MESALELRTETRSKGIEGKRERKRKGRSKDPKGGRKERGKGRERERERNSRRAFSLPPNNLSQKLSFSGNPGIKSEQIKDTYNNL